MKASHTDTLCGFLATRLGIVSCSMEDPDRQFTIALPAETPDSDLRHLILRHYESRGILADIDQFLTGKVFFPGQAMIFNGTNWRKSLSVNLLPMHA